MKNKEKFAEKIEEIRSQGLRIGVTNAGNIDKCGVMPCDWCRYKDEGLYCVYSVGAWLEQEAD